ncbi:GGDEF domain-containing protein [Lacticaseibacillus suihuaensis]
MQGFASFGGYRFWRNHAVMLGSLALAGALAMGLMWVIGGSLDFAGFWSRQIIAFVVIAVGAYEYFRMLLVSQLRVESQIELDELTGLKNFRTFDHDMHTRYAGYRQNGTGLTLLELDIDWFKRINDTYDHLVGNAVLKGVGQATAAFAQALPQTAAAYRLGGEEFCIAVTALPQDAALEVAQALKAKLDALTFTAADHTFSITVSVGLAEAIPADLNYLDVYKRVDHFLYEAKRAGRNRLNIGGRIVA